MDRLLVIGERPEQARALSERLGLFGVEAIPCARDWKLAVRSLTSDTISAILLDVDSSTEATDFFRLLHDLTRVPIAVRGAMSDADRLIWYLDNGAVDYISSAIAPAVVAAKIQQVLRSARSATNAVGVVRVGDVSIDVDSYSVHKSGKPISLTRLEFRLLCVLAENVGKACSRDQLLQRVWGNDFRDCAHYLRLYIAYLRNKLEENPRRPKLLVTEWGYGYRLVGAPSPALTARATLSIAATG